MGEHNTRNRLARRFGLLGDFCKDLMHVPSMELDAVGPIEDGKIIFGWLTEIEAKQELVNIVELGSYVTCYLQISDKDGGILDVVEVFKIDDNGKVEEIWAL